MTTRKSASLKGVIAAAPTPVTDSGEPDLERFVRVCRWLLDNGCDAVNACGTTGEATSLSAEQRMAVMSAAADKLPHERLMAGTGAASVADAVRLTEHAAALGLAAALIVPPFYFKNVSDDGVIAYFDRIVSATANEPIDLYLYNVPQFSYVEYTRPLVERLISTFNGRVVGLKDSSGNIPYSEDIATISPDFAVFPASEAVLLRARAGEFAGCISASANINSELCGRAFNEGDEAALETACAMRALASRKPLVPSVKAVLANKLDDPGLEAVLPPLTKLAEADKQQLLADLAALA